MRTARLRRLFVTIDDRPVKVDELSANSRANLGHDQFRGQISAERARNLGALITQASVIKFFTEYGFNVWEGRVALPPNVRQDGTAGIVGQGHGFRAVKFAQRFPIRIRTGAAFTWASAPPLNMPSVFASAATIPQVGAIADELPTAVNVHDPPALGITAPGVNRCGAAIWAPGVRFLRITGRLTPVTGLPTRVMTADGPNIAASARTEHQISAAAQIDVTFKHPGDCIIIEYARHLLDATTTDLNKQILLRSNVSTGEPFTIYAETAANHIWSSDIAKAIGGRLGFDTSRIGRVGLGPLTHWDWAGGAASGLDDLAGRDDMCWRVFEDAGMGPVLEFGPYRKVWEVSARTGARWDLDPLEMFNRVVAQWVGTRGLVQLELDANPDPFADLGIENEMQVNLAGLTLDPDSAAQTAWRALQAGLQQRYQGRIRAGRAFDGETGREATFEVRPGDLVKIRDFTADGSITLRIADVDYSPDGIALGIEAPAIPIGALSATMGGGNVFGSGGGATPSTSGGGTETYLPPGAPGTPPVSGGGSSPSPSPWYGGGGYKGGGK